MMKKLLRLMSEARRKRIAHGMFKNQKDFLNTLGGNTQLHQWLKSAPDLVARRDFTDCAAMFRHIQLDAARRPNFWSVLGTSSAKRRFFVAWRRRPRNDSAPAVNLPGGAPDLQINVVRFQSGT